MSGALAVAMQSLFNDPNGSEAAELYLEGRLPLDIRVLRRDSSVEGDVSGVRTLSAGTTFEVLQSVCPQPPPNGSVIRVGQEGWKAFDVQANARKGVWVISCEQA